MVPADLPLVFLENDEPEDLYVHNYRTGRRVKFDLASDRPQPIAYTRDGQFAWAAECRDAGPIVNLVTMRVHVDTGALPLERNNVSRFLGWDATITAEDPERSDDEDAVQVDDDFDAAAIALNSRSVWRILGLDGVVVENHVPLFALGFQPASAAFSPDADRLALLRKNEVVVIEVSAQPRVVQRFPLR